MKYWGPYNRTTSNAVNYATGIEVNHLNVASDTTMSNIRYIKNGLTVGADATLTLNTPLRVSGNINFADSTGRLTLAGDLTLASDAYITSDAYVRGAGYALSLTSSFVIPASKTLTIKSDTIIDGGGNEVVFGDSSSKISLDNSVSLTLRNMSMRLFNTNQLTISGNAARLTLQNVILYLDSDYTFNEGYLYIDGDVIMRGDSSFIYNSDSSTPRPMYIQRQALLYFDVGTTFKFNPGGTTPHSSSSRSYLRMWDATSMLYFNGSTFNVPTRGVQLTNGTLIFDNRVYISNKDASNNINTDIDLGITLGGNGTGDLNVYVLAGARVELSGYLKFNNAS
jgi:hypothetical protein